MMTIGGIPHVLMILVSILVGFILFVVTLHSKEKTQNAIIYTLTFICVFGIFFLHGTRYFKDFDFANLLIQMIQVCNFNFILLPLCIFKRNELARQYLFLFSMPMALSSFVSYPSDIENSMWHSMVCLTFWFNHFLIVLIPILMVATKKFKPRKDYIYKVIFCVFLYFLVAFIGNYLLNGFNISGAHNHSYTMKPDGILVLEPLYKLLPIPFIYLLPLAVVLFFFYLLISKLFENYRTNSSFGLTTSKKERN